MTHTQWQSRLRRSLAMVKDDPARALKSLAALAAQLETAAKQRVGDWHIEQTLEALSIVQSSLSDHRASAETILRVAAHHEQSLVYHERAFVAGCATAAIELASAGDRLNARRALRKASLVAAGLRPKERLFAAAEKYVAMMPSRLPGARQRPAGR
jgi:hypothetical protein